MFLENFFVVMFDISVKNESLNRRKWSMKLSITDDKPVQTLQDKLTVSIMEKKSKSGRSLSYKKEGKTVINWCIYTFKYIFALVWIITTVIVFYAQAFDLFYINRLQKEICDFFIKSMWGKIKATIKISKSKNIIGIITFPNLIRPSIWNSSIKIF